MIANKNSTKAFCISSLAYLVISLGLAGAAHAQTAPLEFDSLPSNQGWTFTGLSLAEDAAFDVDGTTLSQTTVGSVDGAAFYRIDNVVDTSEEMSLSFTARVLGYELRSGSATGLGFNFHIRDEDRDIQFGLTEDAIIINESSYDLDTTVFHDYKFDFHPAGEYALFVDGALLVNSVIRTTGAAENAISFGDSAQFENTDVEITALTFDVMFTDVDVQKSVDNEFPAANEPVEFTVQVRNLGTQPAADLVIMDQLPAEMDIPAGTAAFASVGTYDPATGEWSMGDLAAGDSAVLTVPAVVTDSQPPACIVNAARSDFPDMSDDNNDESRAAIHQAGVERCVDLQPEFDIDVGSVVIVCDSERRYEGSVEIKNMGPDAARNVMVALDQTTQVGPDIVFEDSDCLTSGASVCEIASIASGETVSLSVTSALFQNATKASQVIEVSLATSDEDYDSTNDLTSVSAVVSGFSSCDGSSRDFPDLRNVAGPGGCFIATAAYGTAMHPHLDGLRNFRDRFMLTNGAGRAMVKFYYRYSPPIADYIAERGWLKTMVRGLLAPIVYTVIYPGQAALLLIGLGTLVVARRRKKTA